MTDDDLLQAFADAERERLQSRSEAWDELARGRIAPDEAVARVRARGAAPGEDAPSEAELARARELFAPPSASFDDGLVDRLVAMMPPSTGSQPATVIERTDPSWWQRRRVVAWLAVSAAAAAVLAIAWPRGVSDVGPGARVPLPAHEMWIEGTATVRGSSDAVQSVRAGDDVRFGLRPARSYAVQPKVGACLHRGNETRVLSAVPQLGRPGEAFEVDVQLPSDLAAGRWELVAVVAGGELPTDVGASCDGADRDVQVVRKPIDVAP